VQAAWVVLIRPKSWERYGLKPWIEAAKKRLHHNVLAIALANKLARIAWAVLNQIRMHQDEQDGVPSRLSVAPCSDPSRRGLATPKREAKQVRRPALTAPCARRLSASAGRDEGTGSRHEQRRRGPSPARFVASVGQDLRPLRSLFRRRHRRRELCRYRSKVPSPREVLR
jgi:hypothetical protein